MTSDYRLVSPLTHANAGWQPQRLPPAAEREGCCPIVMAELADIVAAYPIAFVRTETGRPRLVAVLGLYPDVNLFADPDLVHVPCLPSAWTTYPFALTKVEHEGQSHPVLCYDHGGGGYREPGQFDAETQRFFTPDGQLTPRVVAIMRLLHRRLASEPRTDQAVALLDGAGVLEPWPMPGGALQGVERIDRERLDALDAAVLARLHGAGALAVAYAQLLSLPRIEVLPQLHTLRGRRAAAAAQRDLDIAGLLANSDTLRFDP